MDANEIGNRLCKLRGNHTQKMVADAIGVCQSTYAMYETGQRIPSDENKRKLADYFNTTVQAIFFD